MVRMSLIHVIRNEITYRALKDFILLMDNETWR